MATARRCSGRLGDQPSADCAGSLAAGDEKTCTITNKRKPKLTVVKVIEGGNGASFDLAVNGSTVLENVGGSGGQVTNTYPVGTDYGVTETPTARR